MIGQTRTVAAALRAVLDEALQQTDEVVLLGETAGRLGLTEGLQAAPEQIRSLPVGDRGTLGLALGMALAGRRPVVELSSTRRLLAGVEVLAEAAAIARRGRFAVPLVVRVPWGTEAGPLDQPVGPLLTAIDGLTVVSASDPTSATGLLRTALAGQGPVVLLEPRTLSATTGLVHPDPLPYTARTLRQGTHLTLAAWGSGVGAALQAAEQLAGEGIAAEVLDLVALHPLDRHTLGASVRRTGRLVVVHPADPALADAARAIGLDDAFLHLESPLGRADEAPEAIARAAREAVHY